MVAFDHRDPGTDPGRWDALVAGPALPAWDDWTDATRIVVLSPHPDDESLAVGGLIARAAALGIPVEVILVTVGEASHPASPTHSMATLARIRAEEFRAALTGLHSGAGHRFLGVPDGASGQHEQRIEDAITHAVATAGARPLLVAPWRGDGHHDHRIAGEAAARVATRTGARLVEYPIWMWHWGDPADETLPWRSAVRVELGEDARAAKARALGAYRSQIEPLSPSPGDEAIVDARHRRHFDRPDEVLFLASSPRVEETPASTDSGTGTESSRSRDSFEEFYERRPGGWDFTSWYESRKRDVLLSALPRERFRRTLELGCATGVLTARLAERSDATVGVDIAEAPLREARRNAPGATFERLTVPDEWPEGAFDLVVMSEVGYYLSEADLDRTVDRAIESLDTDGVFAACHWRHPDEDAVTDATRVHDRIAARWPGRRSVHHVEDDILVDVFVREEQPSIAAEAGLV
ncbi:bifunctional PIG-L family deacetylase/class I SAM-dependent methyltransferase [Labedella endophytica]|uniref:Methyltransferase domain-containing protein n=1 Tax=Labedella endophytica TaxID=1523160 RepID=A0A3S0XD91_9MICO|nr:bifunctional PIG-L family deacetylase/class I SAM-dependent methyltransferase [Labedella endophytica]RUR03184.1 methyltransferase domain-containing protein [Labedella endophytica]